MRAGGVVTRGASSEREGRGSDRRGGWREGKAADWLRGGETVLKAG